MKNKAILSTCLFIFGVVVSVYCESASIYNKKAIEAISIASDTATREKKDLLIIFGADWCPDCQALIKAISDPQLNSFLSTKYVLVIIDVGHFNMNMDIREKYGIPRSLGIPALAIVSTNGEIHKTRLNENLPNARKLTVQQITDEFMNIIYEE